MPCLAAGLPIRRDQNDQAFLNVSKRIEKVIKEAEWTKLAEGI